jgi:1,4-alpha-glucan branching enzyme
MLKKNYSKTGSSCRVTFRLSADVGAEKVFLVGDFNNWDKESTPMKKLKSGDFSVTISLKPGEKYRFRYWLDDTKWENDWEADAYVPNEFGSEDSVVTV